MEVNLLLCDAPSLLFALLDQPLLSLKSDSLRANVIVVVVVVVIVVDVLIIQP